MQNGTGIIRVLYSFPHRLGADRICHTAWQQVKGLAEAGADVTVFPASLKRAVPNNVKVQPTLAFGPLRLPFKIIGSQRAFVLHDYIVSRRIEKLARSFDIIHLWPQGSLKTLKVAANLNIPTALERPNANTRYAYEAVREESKRLGISLPPGHEHAYNEDTLKLEEAEFNAAWRLLCPSEFVLKTFLQAGFAKEKLIRHSYGYDETRYFPSSIDDPHQKQGLTMLFVGVCAIRKGVHFALEAWLKSPAHKDGKFLIAGEFLPDYAEKLASLLAHPSIQVLGHRTDVPDLMRQSDILVLPSIEEGSALVTYEARGSGCVILVSEAAGAICEHMKNALVHPVGDVNKLAEHITLLHQDQELLYKLRSESLSTAPELTWKAAGKRLLQVYRQVIEEYANRKVPRIQ